MKSSNQSDDDDLVVRYGQTQRELDELTELRRAELDLDDPGLEALAVLDLAVSSSRGPDGPLVVAGLAVIGRQAQAAVVLARGALAAPADQPASVTAQWLSGALEVSVIPPGSTPYVEWLTPAEQWVPAEAASIADHCGFLLDELTRVEQHLDRVPPDDRAARTREASAVRQTLTDARDAWRTLASHTPSAS